MLLQTHVQILATLEEMTDDELLPLLDEDGLPVFTRVMVGMQRRVKGRLSDPLSDNHMRRHFNELDANRNGSIDATELRHTLQDKFRMKVSKDDVNEMIRKVDFDGNGNIGFEEWKKIITPIEWSKVLEYEEELLELLWSLLARPSPFFCSY